MARGLFVVRAEVADAADRAAFDRWYTTDHLPFALSEFGALRAWRFWSRSDPAIHYAFYEFADVEKAQALIGSQTLKRLIEDFDRAWGKRVARSREILEFAEEVRAG